MSGTAICGVCNAVYQSGYEHVCVRTIGVNEHLRMVIAERDALRAENERLSRHIESALRHQRTGCPGCMAMTIDLSAALAPEPCSQCDGTGNPRTVHAGRELGGCMACGRTPEPK